VTGPEIGNIMMAIPDGRFDEQELLPLLDRLREKGHRVIVLSRSGKEGRGMGKSTFQPDGMIVDWNKQSGVSGKYHAVLVLGGKGASRSLWDDPILPQILTDHHRSGSLLGAVGTGVVVMARAGLLHRESPGPEDQSVTHELERCGVRRIDVLMEVEDRLILAQDARAISAFADAVLNKLMQLNPEP